ncbi:MAG: hypothetical protein A2381_17615 [Bdellovibrionales bacterium RIFOXYB1_FULL_37_110]|nr:MAG: hypothetical protein A2181_00740 [Bdellovibrionales bacterium RIFOXYA1_FULL_38_20]OFZ48009.1 MAG: hypothetical protein A2417_15590 [Bdellovibrionales bacterium RIFOXYC1_FULL_37_79]OFZ53923.1 MAG: hypothetical protein A2328_11655 [Bdellovibrionales bacterium RIFOXYB2_FULL_36_6]OFZ58026.1 MAG: hypothetical protein A2381_17615 [Bdellovibrionales bacterium RIFOXYB1_FULL_37_110]OFZ61680.1 MAG: hypothetical protein A2577_18170 [Bdellovibrionales bacterium RIFOXYD1_FULL_36_51]
MKWLGAQASSLHPDTLERLHKIIASKDYNKTVPNMIRAIHRTFGRNYIHFHKEIKKILFNYNYSVLVVQNSYNVF